MVNPGLKNIGIVGVDAIGYHKALLGIDYGTDFTEKVIIHTPNIFSDKSFSVNADNCLTIKGSIKVPIFEPYLIMKRKGKRIIMVTRLKKIPSQKLFNDLWRCANGL